MNMKVFLESRAKMAGAAGWDTEGTGETQGCTEVNWNGELEMRCGANYAGRAVV